MSRVKQLSLRKNFSWNFIGSLVHSLSQWLVLVLLAKLGNAELVGLYTLGFAVTAPILMLTNLQLRQVQATDTSNDYTFNDYFGLRIITGIIAILITIIVIIISNYEPYKALIILLIAISKIIDSYSDVIYGQLQQKERMDYIGISRIIKGIVTLSILCTCMLITKSLTISLIVLNISLLFTFFLYDSKKIKYFIESLKPKFSFKKQKKLIILTLPLGLMLMLGSLNTNIPRVLVEKFLGEEALGYFAGIAYLLVAGNMFISAVGQAGAPRLAKLYKGEKLKGFINLLIKLVLLGFGIGILGALVALLMGEFILKLVYTETFVQYNNILIFVMIAGIFSYASSFLGYGLTSMRLFKVQPYLGSIWVVTSIIASFILIPKFGLTGAAVTLIIGSITQFTTSLVVVIINIIIKNRKIK